MGSLSGIARAEDAVRLPEPTEQEIAAARADAGMQPADSGKGKGTDARDDAIKQAVGSLAPAMDQHGTLVLQMREPGGRLTVTDAASAAAEDYIAYAVYENTGKAVSADAVRKVLAIVRAQARRNDDRVHIWNRTAVAKDGKGYVLDRGDSSGSGWQIEPGRVVPISGGDMAFRRGQGYGEHPGISIQSSASDAFACVRGWLRQCWSLNDDDAIAVAVLLVEWVRCDTPQPVLEVTGGAGSGKTTFARQLAALIDPRTGGTPSIRLVREDVSAAVMNNYVLYADNISALSVEEQDLACMAATGATLTTRRLYAQGDVFSVALLNPLIITSIVPALTRADAKTRVLPIKLPPRQAHRSDAAIAREFEAQRPALVGALLTLLSAALCKLDEAEAARQYTTRLASFEILGEAILCAAADASTPYVWGTFSNLLARKRQQSAADAAAGVPVIEAVRRVMAEARQSNPAVSTKPPAPSLWLPRKQYAYIDSNGLLHVGTLLQALLGRVQTPYGSPHGAISSARGLKTSLQIWETTLNDLGIRLSFGKTEAGGCVEFVATSLAQDFD